MDQRNKEARRGGPGLGGTDPWGERVGKGTNLHGFNLSNIGTSRKKNLAKKLAPVKYAQHLAGDRSWTRGPTVVNMSSNQRYFQVPIREIDQNAPMPRV